VYDEGSNSLATNEYNNIEEAKVENFGDNVVNVTSAISKVEAPDLTERPSAYLNTTDIGINTSLEQYLSRPALLWNGTFSASDTGNTNLGFAMTSLFNSAVPSNFIKGKFLVRGTMCLKLQVNANRFNSGRYILGLVPTGGASFTDTGVTATQFFKFHTAGLTPVTQLPHVELDVSRETEVVLKFPYLSSTLGFAQYRKEGGVESYRGDVGIVFLRPYSPLTAPTGSTSCAYSVWGWLEDVKLMAVAQPQMSSYEKKGVGPVESTLKKITKSANILTEIPLLSAVARPTAWMSDIFARAANVWGWSKPLIFDPVTRVTSWIMPYHTCVEGKEPCLPLSLCPQNEVMACPGFASYDEDELSINSFKKRFSFLESFTWTTAGTAGTDLVSGLSLNPSNFFTTFSDMGVTVDNYTPIGLLANLFKYYRGGIKLRLKFVKTEFHSGRLLLVYNPVPFKTTSYSATYANAGYSLREILDIREKNEVIVTIPYVNIYPWSDNINPLGILNVFILDPLVCPSSVSTTITCLVEVCGDDDFEVAVPLCAPLTPIIPYTAQMGENIINMGDTGIGSSSPYGDGITECAMCIGEKLTSLRALAKRFSYAFSYSSYEIDVNPWSIDVNCGLNGSSYYNANVNVPFCNFISSFFALVRGSCRVRVSNNTGGEVMAVNFCAPPSATLKSYFDAANSNIPSTLVSTKVGFNQTAIQYTPNDVAADVNIPFYHHTHAAPVASLLCNSANTIGSTCTNLNVPYAKALISSSSNGKKTVYGAAGDDWSVGCFISIPPLVPSTPTNS